MPKAELLAKNRMRCGRKHEKSSLSLAQRSHGPTVARKQIQLLELGHNIDLGKNWPHKVASEPTITSKSCHHLGPQVVWEGLVQIHVVELLQHFGIVLLRKLRK